MRLRATARLRSELTKTECFDVQVGRAGGIGQTRVCTIAMGLASPNEQEAVAIAAALKLDLPDCFDEVES
jgi:hypothetical protein